MKAIIAAFIAVTTISAGSAAPCDMLTASCNVVAGKFPPIALVPPSAATVTTGMDDDDAAAWERRVLGPALRTTPAALWATRAFGTRMGAFVIAAGGLNGSTPDEALAGAFITAKCDAHNTGYVGPSLPAIKRVLASGNIREVWGLAYVLTKSGYFSNILEALLLQPGATASSVAAAISAAAKDTVADSDAIATRWALVQQTAKLNASGGLHYAEGVPDFGYEGFSSWVRLDFDATTIAYAPLWKGARAYKAAGCSEVALMSNDASLLPKLSADELAYQCNGTTPPCKLHWYPGALCYDVVDTPLTTASGASIKGYAARAAALGYRTAAAASGTTANMLQFASLLGFKGDELVAMRLAMQAWMLVTDDHSFFEIMLGAEPFLGDASEFNLVMGMSDLERLQPPGRTLVVSGTSFPSTQLWQDALAPQLATAAGQAALAAMSPEAKAYVTKLTKRNVLVVR